MKKLLFVFLAGYVPALVALNGVYAHNQDFVASDSIAPVSHNVGLLANISSKAQKDFARSFKNIATAQWGVVSDGFVASFNDADVRTIVYYDKRGRWAGTMKTYFENKMPRLKTDRLAAHYHQCKPCLMSIVVVTGQ